MLRILLAKLSSHVYFLVNDLDPIKNNQRLTRLAYGTNRENGRLNHQFIIPTIVIIGTTIMGIYGVDGHESWKRFEFHWERMATHVMLSKSIWRQTDMLFVMGVSELLLTMGLFLFAPRLDQRFCMQFVKDRRDGRHLLLDSRGKRIWADIAEQIYRRRHKIRRITYWVHWIWMFSCFVAFAQQMIISRNIIWYPYVIFYWIIMVPIFFNYLIYCKYYKIILTK